MKNMKYKVEAYVGRAVNFLTEVRLFDDGDGVTYIKEWNISSEKTKPTDSQLNALESEATKLQNNATIKATRKTAYGDIGEQLDEIYKDIDAWKARIKKIKDDNPKE
jgi:hypothetical protein